MCLLYVLADIADTLCYLLVGTSEQGAAHSIEVGANQPPNTHITYYGDC